MHRGERLAGIAGPSIALGGILLATVLDPGFSWTMDALSDLGIRSESRLVFNGGLILGGLVSVGYGFGLVRLAADTIRLIGAIFIAASLALAGVGAFVIGHPLHLPAAVAFYVLVTVAMAIDAVDRRSTITGQLTAAFVGLHVLVWISWGLGFWPGSGLALPEFAGALLATLWVWTIGPAPALLVRDFTDESSDTESP